VILWHDLGRHSSQAGGAGALGASKRCARCSDTRASRSRNATRTSPRARFATSLTRRAQLSTDCPRPLRPISLSIQNCLAGRTGLEPCWQSRSIGDCRQRSGSDRSPFGRQLRGIRSGGQRLLGTVSVDPKCAGRCRR
jgi:hypothetical protein